MSQFYLGVYALVLTRWEGNLLPQTPGSAQKSAFKIRVRETGEKEKGEGDFLAQIQNADSCV